MYVLYRIYSKHDEVYFGKKTSIDESGGGSNVIISGIEIRKNSAFSFMKYAILCKSPRFTVSLPDTKIQSMYFTHFYSAIFYQLGIYLISHQNDCNKGEKINASRL